ncbi:MAG: glycosyltransferase family 39 protein [Planctomycetes bacterium]|nr:glycosyltransferase family 39 protein [Planctomycetota bacterium]
MTNNVAAEIPASPTRPWLAPVAVFSGAFAVRLAIAIEAWNRLPFLRAPVVDGAEYFIRAREVMAGDWWPRKLEIHPPLYGWLVGAVFTVFGDASFALYALQALIGAATAVLLWRFTKILAGERAAAVAGGLAAVAWPAIFQEVQPSAAGLSLFLAAAAVNLVPWASAGRPLRALAPGFVVGLAAIAHGTMLSFSLLLVLPLLERSRRGALATAAGLAAALVPLLAVCAHNVSLDDGGYALQANVGLNTWIGNNPAANGYPNIMQGPPYDDIVDRAWRAGHMTAGEQDRYFRGEAVLWAATHPLAWLALCGKRLLGTWSSAEVDSSMDAGAYEDGIALDALAFGRWGWLAALALPGAVLLWKRGGENRKIWLAGAVAAGVPLLFFVTSNRYRVPLLVAIVPAAGVALEAAWAERKALATRAGAGLVALAIGGGVLSYANPLGVPTGAYFDREFALGSSRAELKDYPAAEKHFKSSLARRPGDPFVLLMLARVYAKAGARDLSIATTLESLEARPAYMDALVQAAMLMPPAGRAGEVDALFRRAMAAEPTDPRVPGRWGEWLLAQGRPADAIAPLRKAVDLQPRSRGYRANLGLAWLGVDRPADAEPLFESVLNDDPGHPAALFGGASCALARGDRATAIRLATAAAEA